MGDRLGPPHAEPRRFAAVHLGARVRESAVGDHGSEAGRVFSKFQAAMYLYQLTGDAGYREFAEANYGSIVPSWGPSQWDMEKQDATLYLTRLSGVTSEVSAAIVTQFVSNMTNNTDQLPMLVQDQDPYRAPMQDLGWGSNQIKMAQARLHQLFARYAAGAPADTAALGAEEYLHYLHGVNPFGLVYLTNMQRAGAEHSAKTVFHSWFADGTVWDEVSPTTPGPAPGFLAGGPNPSFELDSCCTATEGDAYQCYGAPEFALCDQNWEPPMNQPVLKAYREFNSGWPAGSWPITEPSTGYEAKYILVAAAHAH